MRQTWTEKHGRPCKLGTMPAVVQLHGRDAPGLRVGRWVRVREVEGGKWSSVYVREVRPDGYFQADR